MADTGNPCQPTTHALSVKSLIANSLFPVILRLTVVKYKLKCNYPHFISDRRENERISVNCSNKQRTEQQYLKPAVDLFGIHVETSYIENCVCAPPVWDMHNIALEICHSSNTCPHRKIKILFTEINSSTCRLQFSSCSNVFTWCSSCAHTQTHRVRSGSGNICATPWH